jgi:hypothetical protein
MGIERGSPKLGQDQAHDKLLLWRRGGSPEFTEVDAPGIGTDHIGGLVSLAEQYPTKTPPASVFVQAPPKSSFLAMSTTQSKHS